jgi:hypothetical protein
MARPTDYKEEYIKAADEYLSSQQDYFDEDLKKIQVQLPTIEGFAGYLDVNKTTLYEWEKIHPEFSNALTKIRVEQQKRLLNKGLSGDYNSTIAKLILSSNHGMAERTQADITTGGEPLPIYQGLSNKPNGAV